VFPDMDTGTGRLRGVEVDVDLGGGETGRVPGNVEGLGDAVDGGGHLWRQVEAIRARHRGCWENSMSHFMSQP